MLLLIGSWQVTTRSTQRRRPGAGRRAVQPARLPDAGGRLLPAGDATCGRVDRTHRPGAGQRRLAPTVASETRSPCPTGRSRSSSTTSAFALRPRRAGARRTCTFDVAPGRGRGRRGRRPGRARPRCASCIARLADPDAGTVRVGGVDTAEIDPDVLRGSVAMVFQETFLFAESHRREHHPRRRRTRADEVGAAARDRPSRRLRARPAPSSTTPSSASEG